VHAYAGAKIFLKSPAAEVLVLPVCVDLKSSLDEERNVIDERGFGGRLATCEPGRKG
jgi:hypothetical protein